MVNIRTNFNNYRINKQYKPKQSIQDIDYQVSLDTIVLRAKLTDEQKEFIYDRFMFTSKRNRYYRHSLFIQNMGFTLQVSPKNPLLHSFFNAKITLQSKFFQRHYIPVTICDILNFFDWSIIRLDIAFDYRVNKHDSLLFKHHATLKDATFKNETYYIGNYKAQRKTHTLVNYDRNIKEINRGTEINHEFSNRLETRFQFKMVEMKLHNLNHAIIIKQLKRYLFIQNINELKTDRWTKNRIRKLQHDFMRLKKYEAKDVKKLRKLIKDHREPLETIYEANISRLFGFLKYDDIYAMEYIPLGQVAITNNIGWEQIHEHIS